MDDRTVNSRDRRQVRAQSRHGVDARDAGLNLIQRANRWLVAAAVTCAGAVSLVAEQAFRGHPITAGAATAAARSSPQPQPQPQSAASNAALPSPAQAPAAAQPTQSPVAVSGGS